MSTVAGAPARRARSLGRGAGLVIVSDQSRTRGGTEQVIGAVLRRWPEARVVSLDFLADSLEAPPPWRARARLIAVRGRRRHALTPLYARRIAQVDLGPADLVLGVPGAGWSLAAAVPPGVPFVAYSAGPMRFLRAAARLYGANYASALQPLVRLLRPALRRQEQALLRRPGRLLTNSEDSARALAELRGERPDVLHPPIRTDLFTPGDPAAPREHLLLVARLEPQKSVEVAIDAMRGRPERLVIAGAGSLRARLERRAGPGVTFAGAVSDLELRDLYRGARALIVPSREEFGMAAAEALACGTPVVSVREGGALEVVEHGRTGLLIPDLDGPRLAAALDELDRLPWTPKACREAALRFSETSFVAQLERVLEEELERVG